MRYLVTGGAGFIGSHLVKKLLQNEANRVCCIDKLNYAGRMQRLESVLAHPQIQFEQMDICDAEPLNSVVKNFAPHIIINLAAETHVDNSIHSPGAFIDSNILGTHTLLNESLAYWRTLDEDQAKAFRFYQISTDEVFGDCAEQEGFVSEDAAYRPSSPYAASKAAADHLVQAWHRTYGIPTLISRSSNNFGPWQHEEKLIPSVIRRAIRGESVRVYGSGKQKRDWLHVDDHVRAIELIALRGRVGHSYNISTQLLTTNIELVNQICLIVERLMHKQVKISYVDDRPGHDFCYCSSAAKLRETLGWEPSLSLGQALEETVKSYLHNPYRLSLSH